VKKKIKEVLRSETKRFSESLKTANSLIAIA